MSDKMEVVEAKETKSTSVIQEEDTLNVQYTLDSDEKKKVVIYIKKLVDDSINAHASYRTKLKECMDLYEGVRPPKSDPWTNCSNITTMITATHCKLMHSKLFPAVWNENLIYWKPVEKNDVEGVEKVRTFMDWVIRQDMKLGNKFDDAVHDLVVVGTIAFKIRWDKECRRMRDGRDPRKYKEVIRYKGFLDLVPIDEVHLPYLWRGEDDSEFICQDIYMRLPEIRAARKDGSFNITDDDLKKIEGSIEQTLSEDIRKLKAKNEGVSEFSAHIDSTPIRLIEGYLAWNIGGKMLESVFLIDYNSGVYISGKPLTAVSPTGTRPWVIGQFMRRTDRPHGVGLPELMKGLAQELDAIHNQRVDAGTMTIAPFGFYRAASAFKPDKVQVGPGVMVPVDDINDVKITQLSGNFIASFQEEALIVELIEKLTATSAYQMGRESDIAKSRATATGTMAIIQQGEQAYTLLGLRCQRIVSQVLNKIFQLYQSFMPADLPERIINEETGDLLFPQGLKIEDIAGQYDSYMLLDSTVGNKATERQANATLVQMAPNLMALAQDIRGYRIAEDFLKSIGKMDVERYLGPKPVPQEPIGMPNPNVTGQGIPIGAGMDGGIAPAQGV